MVKYAQTTTVGSDRSRSEIERTLERYGASRFIYGWEENQAIIGFEMRSRRIRFLLPLPDKASPEFQLTPTGKARSPASAHQAWEQSTRQRWWALALVIKAKLEAIESGITTFDEEFLAHIVLPSGEAVGDWMAPQIEQAYLSGKMPPMLPIATNRTNN